MHVTVENKGNKTFKLTVTSSNEVRIKIQDGADECLCDYVVFRFKEIAEEVIKEGLNTSTLRGKCTGDNTSVSLYTDSNVLVKTFDFDY